MRAKLLKFFFIYKMIKYIIKIKLFFKSDLFLSKINFFFFFFFNLSLYATYSLLLRDLYEEEQNVKSIETH